MIVTRGHGAVVVLSLQRDERRNALDVEHCQALRGQLRDAVAAGARAVVITGQGRAFCAGADLDAVHSPGFRRALADLLAAVCSVPVPVIAAVHAAAIGAGTQLAIAADLRVAGPAASFAVPTARLGLAVDRWTVRRLRDLAGTGRTGALLVGLERLDAAAAHACGLVDRLDADPLAAAIRWAAELAEAAPLSLRYASAAVREQAGDDPDRLDAAFQACWDSSDATEQVAARAEGRPARFTGR